MSARGDLTESPPYVRFALFATKSSRRSGPPFRAICCREQMQQPALREPDLFYHLVGAQQNRGRQIEAERPGHLEIDDELDFGRLLDR
jgi:hypothetical protein